MSLGKCRVLVPFGGIRFLRNEVFLYCLSAENSGGNPFGEVEKTFVGVVCCKI